MKILLTVHQFFPEYYSGTEVLTYSVAKELIRRGHEVYVLTGYPARQQMADEERFDQYDFEGIHVFRFHHAYVPMGGQAHVTEVEYSNLLVARYFAAIIRDVSPDIVHFFHLSRLGAMLIDVVQKARIPAYFTPTDFWSVCPTSQLLLDGGRVCSGPSAHGGNCVKHVAALTRGKKVQWVTRFVSDGLADWVAGATSAGRLPDYYQSREVAAMSRRKGFIVDRLNALQGIVSPTRLMTDVLTHNGVDPNRIVQSAYGIDIDNYAERKPSTDHQQKLTIGFIGTLAPHKGCHVLIEAMKGVPADGVRLKIYGKETDFPDYFATLKASAAKLPQVEFCGTFPNHRIGDILAGIDVLVVPSLWYENTPLVIYSALAARCPVVASDFPGMSEVVRHRVNGLTFKPGDALALRAAIASLSDEEGLLGAMRERCQRPKSSREYVDELLSLYGQHREPGAVAKAPAGGWMTVEPLSADAPPSCVVTGWAMLDSAGPAIIRLKASGKIVAETALLLPRPDVKAGMEKAGIRIKSSRLGFSLVFSEPVERASAELELVTASGRVESLAIADMAIGNATNPVRGMYLAIDSERGLA